MSNVQNTMISIVILNYNRPQHLDRLLSGLSMSVNYSPFEVLVIDNCSDEPVAPIVKRFGFARVIRMESNVGVAGRNRGLQEARGSIIITLDDDVFGIGDEEIQQLKEIFSDPIVGAVCFQVLDDTEDTVINWCHHYKVEEYSEKEFLTNEITEGAVAFRREALQKSGYYPEHFFISHEGPDLAFRIMNAGYNVIYTPKIRVKHYHAKEGRPSWRRYYYDTRNLIWLVLRNYGVLSGFNKLFTGLGAMFVYSVRDGFLRYWFKAIWDGVLGGPSAIRARTPMAARTLELNRHIESFRPGFWYMVRKRLFSRKVRI